MIREFLRSVYHHMIGRSDAPAAPVQTEDVYPAPRIYNPDDFCPPAYPENEATHIAAAHAPRRPTRDCWSD